MNVAGFLAKEIARVPERRSKPEQDIELNSEDESYDEDELEGEMSFLNNGKQFG